jgi:hypothetical protein
MRRPAALAAPLLTSACLLALTACGGSSDASDKADTSVSSPSPNPTPSPTATVTVTEPTEPTCEMPAAQHGNVLALSWSLVVASRGAADHPELAEEFFDGASELAEQFEDGNCEGEPASTAAMLAYQASLVNAYALTGGGDDKYRETVRVGNQLLTQMGSDSQFIPITCTGKVGKTPECKALGLG